MVVGVPELGQSVLHKIGGEDALALRQIQHLAEPEEFHRVAHEPLSASLAHPDVFLELLAARVQPFNRFCDFGERGVRTVRTERDLADVFGPAYRDLLSCVLGLDKAVGAQGVCDGRGGRPHHLLELVRPADEISKGEAWSQVQDLEQGVALLDTRMQTSLELVL